MSQLQKIKHPLVHNGTSQVERLLTSLKPENFKLDDRSIKDFIVSSHNYAKLLCYYNDCNEPDGDWSAFWEVEGLTFLAILSEIDVEAIEQGYLNLEIELAEQLLIFDDSNDPNAIDPTSSFNKQFLDYLFQQAASIQSAWQLLPDELELKAEIQSIIKKDYINDAEQLQTALRNLIGWHKAVNSALNHDRYNVFFYNHWGITDQKEYDFIKPDTTYTKAGFDQLLRVFLKALSKIKMRANYWFEKELADPTLHQPHIALYLSFLFLFRHAQNSMNDLTEKQLNFYYEKVLCLQRKKEIPDEVYLIFELANDFNNYLVEEGTLLFAGKDKNRKLLAYETIEDWVLSKTSVVSLKTAYLGIDPDAEGLPPERTIMASAAQANTGDGAGGPFNPPDLIRWRGFGDDNNLAMPSLGFAIASPQLILKEGKRTIEVELVTDGEALQELTTAHFDLEISSEEEMLSLYQKDDPALATLLGAGTFELTTEPCTIKGCFTEMEAARRMVADFTADVGVYVEDAAENELVKAIYNRKQSLIPSLNKSVFQNAFALITDYSNDLANNPSPEKAGTLLFKRAYCYWVLAKTFAPPYVLDPNDDILSGKNADLKTGIPQLPDSVPEYFKLGELYDFIITDLNKALEPVPDLSPVESGEKTMVVKDVVKFFLGRIQMQIGKFSDAIKILDEIISQGSYNLIDDFDAVFSGPNEEVIWWPANDCETEEKSSYAMYSWQQSNGNPSDKRVMAASRSLLAAYDGEPVDKRKKLFEVEIGHDPDFPNTKQKRFWCNKYNRIKNKSIPIFRYTEVLFNKAICLIILSNPNEALDLLNKIRIRAGRPIFTEIDINEGNAIAEERLREFAFEGDRRDFLQVLKSNIPTRDNFGRLPWDSPNLYFQPGTIDGQDDCCEEGDGKAIFKLDIPNDFPPIVHLKEDNHLSKSTTYPYLKIKLRKSAPQLAQAYKVLHGTKLKSIYLNVEAKGIRENLIIQNDSGLRDGTEEFLPFGPNPKIGNHFYIGSAEVFQKRLTCMNLHFDWIDPPNDLNAYYSRYQTYYRLPDPYINAEFQNAATLPGKKRVSAVSFPEPTVNDVAGVPVAILDIPQVVEGKITDPSGTALKEVTVIEKGTNIEAKTDLNGNYTIKIQQPDPVLVFAHPDFSSIEVDVINSSIIDVVLGLDTTEDLNKFRISSGGVMLHDFEIIPTLTTRDIRATKVSRYQPTDSRGVLRITLEDSDFLHGKFSNLLTALAFAQSRNPNDLPNAPYTPVTNGISLDYCSTQKIYSCCSEVDGIDQFFHLMPCEGVYEISLKKEDTEEECGKCLDIVNRFKQPTFNEKCCHFANGNLYLGLSDFAPGENLSLLIQVMEGTEKDFTKLPPKMVWSQLTKGNKWLPFGASHILKDTTEGLTKTGLVQLATSLEMVKENTLFDNEFHWIRVSVVEEEGNINLPATSILALPDIISIKAQGFIARFKNQDNETSHLAEPLPEGTVSKLLVAKTEIKNVEQPFESFGGRLPENGNEYYRRVSERLRHKDRAVSIWDYEHLLLEKYDEIHRAKCISHSNQNTELAPGYVLIAVIPDIKQRSGILKAEPRFSFGDLEEMEDFLKTKTNLFVATDNFLQIINPNYEPIRLKFNVKFNPGVDEIFHRLKLNNELNIFLAPWLSDAEATITFGSELPISKIIHFIEDRDYVDGISDFCVFHYPNSLEEADCDAENNKVKGSRIIPRCASSVLTTYLKKNKMPNDLDHCIYIVENLCKSTVKPEPC